MNRKMSNMKHRQLKFRVYIPDYEIYTNYFELGHFEYSDRYLYQDKYPVQQCTGLKDKHGVYIYEGDLLQFKYKDDGVIFTGEVGYSEKFACFIVVVGKAFETFSDLADYATSFEVVGNICENETKSNE
jgi:uncharacterized phage protein (TIGR01671 family)